MCIFVSNMTVVNNNAYSTTISFIFLASFLKLKPTWWFVSFWQPTGKCSEHPITVLALTAFAETLHDCAVLVALSRGSSQVSLLCLCSPNTPRSCWQRQVTFREIRMLCCWWIWSFVKRDWNPSFPSLQQEILLSNLMIHTNLFIFLCEALSLTMKNKS